ncbi:MAG: hypothetical protein H6703_13095 [Myxococcales bacterium]|nr:hypothetical protein [Myxococcales bacterium]
MRSLIPPAILALGLGCAEQSAPPPASPAAPAEAPAAAADTAQRALTAALPEARDIPTLRRDYAPTLPAATAADRAALTAQSQDPAAAPAARVAATIALGAEVAPETSRALRAALDATMKQITTAARPTTTDAVRVAAAVWPLVGDRVEALPPIVRAALDAPTPGEGRAWTEATAAAPLPPLGPAEVPYLTRHAVAPTPNASWLARLLLAGIDDPRATDALLHLPPARYGDPGSDRDLAEWALTLHATLPAARARITRALDPATPARARDRAAAALAPHREPAAIDAITALLDRVAAAPQGPDRDPPIALGPLIDEAAAWADPRLLTALARYGQSDAPHRVRARRAAEAAGQAPDKAALLDRLDRDPTDDRARQALPPLLGPADAPRLAALLDRARWAIPGFYHHVRLTTRLEPSTLTPQVVTALEAIAREHPEERTRDWALEALGRAPGPLAPALTEAAARGSRPAVRAVITRAPDPWQATRDRITSEDDAIRRAAYEVLVARQTLPFQMTPERATELVALTARHLGARPEDPFVFLRTLRHYVALGRSPENDAALARVLRPYAISTDPAKKPWWDALHTLVAIDAPAAQAVIADAIAAIPTLRGRRVMRERLALPRAPEDDIPLEEPPRRHLGGGF